MVTLQPGIDIGPPYTLGHDPTKGATGVPVDTNVVVHVKDDGAGVDQSSILLTVEGVDVTGQSAITGDTGDYTITYNHPTDFGYGQVVNVTVDARDLAITPNVMPTDSYSFTTVATGTIQGYVYRQGNADHSGVTVSAVSSGDGNLRTTTDGQGRYTIPGLIPGAAYMVTASMRGFLPATKADVMLTGGETRMFADVTLLAGDLDNNGVIDIKDPSMLAGNLGKTRSPWPGSSVP